MFCFDVTFKIIVSVEELISMIDVDVDDVVGCDVEAAMSRCL